MTTPTWTNRRASPRRKLMNAEEKDNEKGKEPKEPKPKPKPDKGRTYG